MIDWTDRAAAIHQLWPKFTDDLRTILRQFSDFYDNLVTTGEFTEHLLQT